MELPADLFWSDRIDIGSYFTFGFTRPRLPSAVSSFSLGPLELNQSFGSLVTRYWLVTQEETSVVISKAEGNQWVDPVVLFEELSPIINLALTFDQLGRPLVFYNILSTELKLYWFNPVSGANEVKSLGAGFDPVAQFTYPFNTNLAYTDMHVYYVKDNRIYQRIQRERFDVERFTGVEQDGIRVESAGLRLDNRFQVIYTYPGV